MDRHSYLLFLVVVLLTSCAGQLAQRSPASEFEAMSAVEACHRDFPDAAKNFCDQAQGGYADCRKDYANNSPSQCLQAQAGYADCRRDYLNLGVSTCLRARAGFHECRASKKLEECLVNGKEKGNE